MVDIKRYLPPFLFKDEINGDLYDSVEKELQLLYDRIEDYRKQRYIQTATWTLTKREEQYALPLDSSFNYENRRNKIFAKRGIAGTATPLRMKQVVERLIVGTAYIIEHEYEDMITIKIEGSIPNLDELLEIVEQIKPAHIGVIYEYVYLLIKDIHEVKTLAEMDSLTLNKFEGGVIYAEDN